MGICRVVVDWGRPNIPHILDTAKKRLNEPNSPMGITDARVTISLQQQASQLESVNEHQTEWFEQSSMEATIVPCKHTWEILVDFLSLCSQ